MGWFITEVTFYGTVSELISLLWEMDVIDDGSIIDGGVKIIVPAGRDRVVVLKPKTMQGGRTKLRVLGDQGKWQQLKERLDQDGWLSSPSRNCLNLAGDLLEYANLRAQGKTNLEIAKRFANSPLHLKNNWAGEISERLHEGGYLAKEDFRSNGQIKNLGAILRRLGYG